MQTRTPPLLFKEDIVIKLLNDEETDKSKTYIELQLRKIEEESNILVGTFLKNCLNCLMFILY